MTDLAYISNHAVKRYCERILNIQGSISPDMFEAVRAKMHSPDLARAARLRVKKFKVGDAVFVMRGGAVVTTKTPDMRDAKPKKYKRKANYKRAKANPGHLYG